MTEDEATGQAAAFLRPLGAEASPALPVTCRIREALLTFEYDDAKQALSVLALIYRFHTEPRPAVVEALRRGDRTIYGWPELSGTPTASTAVSSSSSSPNPSSSPRTAATVSVGPIGARSAGNSSRSPSS